MSKLEMIGVGILAALVLVWRVDNLVRVYRQQRGAAAPPRTPDSH